jgi:diphthine synthase
MGELVFVGAGLGDESDISPRARRRLQEARVIFAESYTSLLPDEMLDRLSHEIDRPIVRLDREALESGAPVLAALRGAPSVALLVGGDPFAATTHVALRLQAEEAGHSWTYLPNASVLTAAPSFLGLMHYRFGRTVSLPFPEPHFAPRSPLDAIERNREGNLHTLVLLDLRPGQDRFFPPQEAVRMLPTAPDQRIAVVARVGTPLAQAWYGTTAELDPVDLGPPLHCLVVPAPELHFQEEAALQRFRPRPVVD